MFDGAHERKATRSSSSDHDAVIEKEESQRLKVLIRSGNINNACQYFTFIHLNVPVSYLNFILNFSNFLP